MKIMLKFASSTMNYINFSFIKISLFSLRILIIFVFSGAFAAKCDFRAEISRTNPQCGLYSQTETGEPADAGL